MICHECGNQILHGCSPVCLVCQHTGRHEQTATEKLMVANLRAVYAALETKEQEDAAFEVLMAQDILAGRIANPEHNRKRPNWDEVDADERERQEVCPSCNGTGRWMNRHCPDCYEPDERE